MGFSALHILGIFCLIVYHTVQASTPSNVVCAGVSSSCKYLRSKSLTKTQSVLFTKQTINHYQIKYECLENGNEITAKIICNSEAYMVNGTATLSCTNGKWSSPLAENCIAKPPAESHTEKWIYIAGGLGGGCALVVILVVIAVVVVKRNHRLKKAGSDTVIPMHTSEGQFDLRNNSVYKVWTVHRSRKKVIVANGINHLKDKVEQEVGLTNARFVLEEDGTTVENDASLMACADKVLIALTNNDVWRPENNPSNMNNLTFDVCTCDRNRRKLILARDLTGLKTQCSTVFRCVAERVCLEIDGTIIDTDDALVAVSDQTLMVLPKDQIWMKPHPGICLPDNNDQLNNDNVRNQRISDNPQRVMYKVWSSSGAKKKIVFAENLIDLHIQGARALGLESPVKVTVKDTSEEVTDDDILWNNKNNILVISRPMPPQPVNFSYNTADQPIHRQNYPNDDPRRFSITDNLRGLPTNQFQEPGKGNFHEPMRNPFGEQTMNHYNEPMSDQFREPSRTREYLRDIREPIREPLTSHPSSMLPPLPSRGMGRPRNSLPRLLDSPMHSPPSYHSPDTSSVHPRHLPNEYSPFPAVGHAQTTNHRHSNEMQNGGLPYADLAPHHHAARQYRRPYSVDLPENFQIPNHDRRRTESEHGFNMGRYQLSNAPYIVSGDAPQSQNSDVLF